VCHRLPHVFAFSMCNVYSCLFSCCFFLYRYLISFFILSVRTCVSVSFAASECVTVFILMLAYFGVILCVRHVLLKCMSALHFSSFLLVFLYCIYIYIYIYIYELSSYVTFTLIGLNCKVRWQFIVLILRFISLENHLKPVFIVFTN
jgi:hypothetical protein